MAPQTPIVCSSREPPRNVPAVTGADRPRTEPSHQRPKRTLIPSVRRHRSPNKAARSNSSRSPRSVPKWLPIPPLPRCTDRSSRTSRRSRRTRCSPSTAGPIPAPNISSCTTVTYQRSSISAAPATAAVGSSGTSYENSSAGDAGSGSGSITTRASGRPAVIDPSPTQNRRPTHHRYFAAVHRDQPRSKIPARITDTPGPTDLPFTPARSERAATVSVDPGHDRPEGMIRLAGSSPWLATAVFVPWVPAIGRSGMNHPADDDSRHASADRAPRSPGPADPPTEPICRSSGQ